MVDLFIEKIYINGLSISTNTEPTSIFLGYNNVIENAYITKIEKTEEEKPKKKKPHYLEIAEKKRKKQRRINKL